MLLVGREMECPMISSISIGSKVICKDGSQGTLTAVIVDRASRSLTHIAIVEKSVFHGEEWLIPIERVTKSERDLVHIDCTADELSKMEPFTRTHYLEVDQGGDGYAYSPPYMMTYSDVTMTPEPGYLTVQDQLVPEGGVAVNRGMAVEALDGYVGQVGELLIDSSSGQITHFLLMKGHGWGKKEIAIELPLIDRVEADTIHLKIEKEKIYHLPSLPVKRDWDEVVASDLELMVWVFEGKELAQHTYQKVKELSKQYAMEVLNATIIEKDQNGDTHLHEVKKVPTKRKVTLGIALGGLAGVMIGPVALVAGAIAGAAAGKKSASKIEVGFSKDKLQKLNECLVPGGSALVLLVEHRWFNTLQLGLVESGGQLIYERLADITYDELVEKLSAGAKDT
jgi:uncharacterized membrane protein/sporulation protein YlmC with PRC-barrel domain